MIEVGNSIHAPGTVFVHMLVHWLCVMGVWKIFENPRGPARQVKKVLAVHYNVRNYLVQSQTHNWKVLARGAPGLSQQGLVAARRKAQQ